MINSTTIKLFAVLFAMVTFATAAPHPKVADVKTGHVGTGDINLNGALSRVVNADDLHLHDAVQNLQVL